PFPRPAPRIRRPSSSPGPDLFCPSEPDSTDLVQGNFIRPGKDQGAFFGALQGLDLQFPRTGATAGMTALLIDHLQRLPAPKILGSPARGVLGEATLQVGCDAGIERVVRAKDYIDLPVHVRAAETVFIRGMSA